MIKKGTAQAIADCISEIYELKSIALGNRCVVISDAATLERKIFLPREMAAEIAITLISKKREQLKELSYKAQSELNEDDGK